MANEEDRWIEMQRKRAEEYLHAEQVDHFGVGEYPAFHVHPFLALWAVQSKRSPGWIGWWVVTGDLPADYISSSEGRHPRDALRTFARHWQEVSEFMLRGQKHPDYRIGTPDQWPKLGDLLQSRAQILSRHADDDEFWAAEEA